MDQRWVANLSGSMSQSRPSLPPTTPSLGPLGRQSPYSTTLEPHFKSTVETTVSKKSHFGMHETSVRKQISKLPYEVRESITSFVNMVVFNAENALKQIESNNMELITLRGEVKRKTAELEQAYKRCDITRDQMKMIEEKYAALQDDMESRQNFASRNNKVISRLASTNRTLIEAFKALEKSKDFKMSSRSSKPGTPSSPQRRGGIPPSVQSDTSKAHSPLLDVVKESLENTNPRNPHRMSSFAEDENRALEERNLLLQNEKLRASLLRVAKEYHRTVKNVETLELKVIELRNSLRYAEKRNIQMQLEIEELRDTYSLDSGSRVGGPAHQKPSAPQPDRSENSGDGKVNTVERMDARLQALLSRNAFDPMEGIKQMRSILAHLTKTPSSLLERDVAMHLCSKKICKLFDVEGVCIFVVQPGGAEMNKYTTLCKESVKLTSGEEPSLADSVIRNGLLRRHNNMKDQKNGNFNSSVDGIDGISIRRVLSIPLRESINGRIVGAMHLLNRKHNNKFSEVDELFCGVFCDLAGSILASCLLFQRMWERSEVVSDVLQAPEKLHTALPDRNSIAANNPLLIEDVMYTTENVARDSLKCSNVKVFVRSKFVGLPEGEFVVLSQSAIKLMQMKGGLLSCEYSPEESGVAGYVVRTKEPYLVEDINGDSIFNPQIDLQPNGDPMYCVPLYNAEQEVFACIELVPSSLSPKLAVHKFEREGCIPFEHAAQWLAFQLSLTLSHILSLVGTPACRPCHAPPPIASSAKLAEDKIIYTLQQSVLKSATRPNPLHRALSVATGTKLKEMTSEEDDSEFVIHRSLSEGAFQNNRSSFFLYRQGTNGNLSTIDDASDISTVNNQDVVVETVDAKDLREEIAILRRVMKEKDRKHTADIAKLQEELAKTELSSSNQATVAMCQKLEKDFAVKLQLSVAEKESEFSDRLRAKEEEFQAQVMQLQQQIDELLCAKEDAEKQSAVIETSAPEPPEDKAPAEEEVKPEKEHVDTTEEEATAQENEPVQERADMVQVAEPEPEVEKIRSISPITDDGLIVQEEPIVEEEIAVAETTEEAPKMDIEPMVAEDATTQQEDTPEEVKKDAAPSTPPAPEVEVLPSPSESRPPPPAFRSESSRRMLTTAPSPRAGVRRPSSAGIPPPTPTKTEVEEQQVPEGGASGAYGAWVECVNDDGYIYYYNNETGESAWDPPAGYETEQPNEASIELIRVGDWVQQQDQDGNIYWYNETTGESAWELPENSTKSLVSASAGGYTIEL